MWRLALGLVAFFGLGFALLWAGNLPRSHRHKQVWSPLLALVIVIISVGATYAVTASVGASGLQGIRQAFQQTTGISGAALSTILLALNGAGLLFYAVLKMIVNGSVRLLSEFQSSSFSAARRVAYEEHDEGVALKPEWYFPGLLSRSTALVALSLPLFCILGQTIFDPLALLTEVLSLPSVQYPALPGLPAFLLFEIGWYLNGHRAPEVETIPPEIDSVDTELKGTYDDLWTEYQEIWPEKVLAASRQPTLREPQADTPRIDFEDEDTELRTIWSDLLHHPEVQSLDEDDFGTLSYLWNGENLLIEDPSYDRIAPVLAATFYYDVTTGDRILILVNPQRSARLQSDPTRAPIRWISEWITTLYGIGDSLQIDTLDAFRRRGRDHAPDILVASAEELSNLNILGRGRDEDIRWFSEVKKVVVLDGSTTVFRHTQPTSALLHTLAETVASRDDSRSLQFIALSENRRNLQPSLRQILPTKRLTEKRLPFPRTENPYVICWGTEDQPFQNTFFDFAGYRIGDEPVLALPAWRENLRAISIVEQQALPYTEFLEELDKRKEQLYGTVVPPSSLAGRTSQRLSCYQNTPWLTPQRDRSVTIVRDRYKNLAYALRRWFSAGRSHSFVHVLSPPYLLRDYFVSNVDFFLEVDAPVVLQSPRFVRKTEAFIAHQLLRRLMSEWKEEQHLHRALEKVGRGDQPVEDALQNLFKSVFGIDVLGNSLLDWKQEYRYNSSADRFVETTLFHLRRKQLLTDSSLDWMASISVVDETGDVLDTVPREHLFQTFLPGQSHSFDGRPYRIQDADLESQELRVTHEEEWNGRVGYRPDLNVTVDTKSESPLQRHEDTHEEWTVVRELWRAETKIDTNGYFQIHAEDGSWTPSHEECSAPVPRREYEDALIARLSFRTPAGDSTNSGTQIATDDLSSISWTLSVLLRELLPTAFPDMASLILVLPPEHANAPFPHVLPNLNSASDLLSNFQDSEQAGVELYLLEDSRSELGVLPRILKDWADFLEILDDYLHWGSVEDEVLGTQTSDDWKIQVNASFAFLDHVVTNPEDSEEAPRVWDLEATRDFLAIFFDEDKSSLRNLRQNYYEGDSSPPHRVAEGEQQCDFCRRPLSEMEYEQLMDGRVRCQKCTAQATDTEEELQEVYHDARSFLEDTLGRNIAHDVNVNLTDTRAVQEAAGKEFVPTSSFDPRTLGIAIRDQDGLSILVENGQPYYMAKGVIVHELTHIWQFENLNYQRLKSEEGKTLVEGHAKWTQLQSIQHIPEAERYIERQKSRNDEYGVGYRRICDLLDDDLDLDTPFEYLSRHYGKA